MKTELFQPKGKITEAVEFKNLHSYRDITKRRKVEKNLNETVRKEYNGILAGGNSLCSFSYKSLLKKPEVTRK